MFFHRALTAAGGLLLAAAVFTASAVAQGAPTVPPGRTGVNYQRVATLENAAKRACDIGTFLGARGALISEAATSLALATQQLGQFESTFGKPDAGTNPVYDGLVAEHKAWTDYFAALNSWQFQPPRTCNTQTGFLRIPGTENVLNIGGSAGRPTGEAEPLFEYTIVLPDRPRPYTARIVDKATGRTIKAVSIEAHTVNNWAPYGELLPGHVYQLQIDGKTEAEFTPSEGQVLEIAARHAGSIQVAIDGAATSIQTPQTSGGTQIVGGAESSILRTARWLHGGGGSINLQWEFAREYLEVARFMQAYLAYAQAVRFFMKASFNGVSGSESGSVPIGGASVAQTYLFPNPDGGSTGISAGATGQSVSASTDGRVYDVSPGLRFDFFPTSASPSNSSGTWTVTPTLDIGARYRHLTRKDHINQQSLTYTDLYSNIDLDTQSNFFAPNIGAGLRIMPAGPSGIFANLRGSVAPGVLWTEASASQFSRCGPCGTASPEYSLNLERSFSDTTFSVVTGVGAEVGYQLSPLAKVSVFGSYEYTSRVPFVDVPISPSAQPATLGYGASGTWQVGAQLKVLLGDVRAPERF